MTPRPIDVAGRADGWAALPIQRARPNVSLGGRVLPLRDAVLATVVLVAAIMVGSRGGATLDPALFGYLGATLVAAFATTWRMSAFWRRPASAFYARAFFAALGQPRRLRRTVAFARRDLVTQEFIRRRSVVRWIAHLSLSLGTLLSFAITLPLVFGWMHFTPVGPRQYRMVLFAIPTVRFDVTGVFAWLVFHALSIAAIAVVGGAFYFLCVRVRARRLPGATAAFALAPLLLLLAVALTGLALPASRHSPAAFRVAAGLHQASVIILLLALPFSKLGHVMVRPLQLGARAVRAPDQRWRRCSSCGASLAPTAQHDAVAELLARRAIHFAAHLDRCQSCRRRQVATAQAALVGGVFQPRVTGNRTNGGQCFRTARHCEAMPSDGRVVEEC